MPALRNIRHERFAQELFKGLKSGRTQGASYIAAGYQVDLPVAEAAASRLLKNVKTGVAARVRELSGGAARRAEITAANVLEKLDRVYEGASEAKQFSAAGRAAEAQARIAGVDAPQRIEIGGPGDYESDAEMLTVIANNLGPVVAATLAWGLDHENEVMSVDEIAARRCASCRSTRRWSTTTGFAVHC
jgi:hypothetical protein